MRGISALAMAQCRSQDLHCAHAPGRPKQQAWPPRTTGESAAGGSPSRATHGGNRRQKLATQLFEQLSWLTRGVRDLRPAPRSMILKGRRGGRDSARDTSRSCQQGAVRPRRRRTDHWSSGDNASRVDTPPPPRRTGGTHLQCRADRAEVSRHIPEQEGSTSASIRWNS